MRGYRSGDDRNYFRDVTPYSPTEFDLGWPKHFEDSAILRIINKFLYHSALTFDNDGNVYTNQELYLEISFSSWERSGDHSLRFSKRTATGAWNSDMKRRICSLCE